MNERFNGWIDSNLNMFTIFCKIYCFDLNASIIMRLIHSLYYKRLFDRGIRA